MWFVLIALVACLLATFYIFVRKCHGEWQKLGVPNVPPTFFFGNMKEAAMGRKNMSQEIVNVYRQFCNSHKYCGFYKFLDRSVMICDPELINDVTVKDFQHFHDNEMVADPEVDYIMSKNVFVLKGHHWKTMRSLISPMFSSGKLKHIFPMVDEVGQKLVKYLNKEIDADRGKCVDGKNLCSRFTTDNVASCAFGLDGKAFEGESQFVNVVRDFADVSYWNSMKLMLIFMFPKLNSYLKLKFFKDETERYVTSVIRETLAYRQANNIVRNDFLDNINALKEKSTEYKFTERDVVAQSAGFFIDGIESSASVMSYIVYEIAKHPLVQQKVRDEIESFKAKNAGKLTYEAINEMPYLDATIMETLRVDTPGAAMFKVCTKEYTLPPINDTESTRLTLFPGDSLVIPIEGLHTNPAYFPEPERFDPERFLDANRENIMKNTFMPFGNGPRFCIGQRFGLLQIKVAVTAMVAHFNITVNPKMLPHEVHPTSFIRAPKNGFMFVFEKL